LSTGATIGTSAVVDVSNPWSNQTVLLLHRLSLAIVDPWPQVSLNSTLTLTQLLASSDSRKKKKSFPKCMSFVPAPEKANAAGPNNAPAPVNSTAVVPAAEPESDKDLLFKLRTFDVYWVDKTALMYRDGIDKVRKNTACCGILVMFTFLLGCFGKSDGRHHRVIAGIVAFV
jgi:hypothetical protein